MRASWNRASLAIAVTWIFAVRLGLVDSFAYVPSQVLHNAARVRPCSSRELTAVQQRPTSARTAPSKAFAGWSRVRLFTRGGWGNGRRETGDRGQSDWSLSTAVNGPASSRAAFPSAGGNTTVTATQGLIADLPGSAHKADVTGGRTQEQGGSETLTDQAGSSSSGGSSNSDTRSKQSFLKTLWDFSRPHTMIGTAMAIPSIGLFAAPAGVLPGRRFFLSMAWAMVPSLLINVYITGLNQITDVEIDKVNKPFLPIPAGNLTPFAARATVTLCLLAGVLMGLAPSTLGSPGLALTVVLSVLIGTGYSLPPLRLKRFPQVAAMCILVVRGSIINGGFYSHAKTAAYGLATEKTARWALTLPLRDAKCALALAYFTVFAIVIALMKDVPDVAGDRKFNIPSFSVVLGEVALFAFARRLLTTLLWSSAVVVGVGARAAALASLPWTAASRGFVAISALVSGQLVRRRAEGVDPKQPSQVYKFYMFLWKIFYASYLFLPLAR